MRGHVRRHAEKVRDDHDGDGFGEGFDEVGGSGGGEPVDKLVREFPDLRAKALDLAGQERRIDETAQPGVDRRFEFEKGVFFEFVERCEVCRGLGPAEFFAGGEVEDLASEAPVAEKGAHIFMGGKAPQTELLPVKNRASRAPLRVKRIRILHEILIPRVQGDAAFHEGEVVSAARAAQCGLIDRLRPLTHDGGVRIMFFAQLRQVCGTEVAEIDADGVDRTRLWELLLARWPGLETHRAGVRLARNGAYAEPCEIFQAGDEVALIPPVSGG